MSARSRDPVTSRLTMNNSPPKLDPHMAQSPSLQDRFYPIRTSFPSCIQFPSVGDNNFMLKSQFINTLPKSYGLESEDTYFIIREFEEACLVMKISHLEDDAIRLHSQP